MTIKEAMEMAKRAQTEISTPQEVVCFFGSKPIMMGELVSFGDDFLPLKNAREATEWLVSQLGGSVYWD